MDKYFANRQYLFAQGLGLARDINDAMNNTLAFTTFTFQVQDDGGIANGGVNLDPVANVMTIDVVLVNDTPSGADITLTTLEDTPYAFTAANFGFSDASDAPANTLQSVVITTLPTAGTLTLAAGSSAPGAVTAGQEISAADIPFLRFTPALNANGAAYATMTFQVRDNGGTLNGGVNLDGTPNTVTFDLTSVNDAPAGTNNTLTTLEDTPLTFTAANFGFTDAVGPTP